MTNKDKILAVAMVFMMAVLFFNISQSKKIKEYFKKDKPVMMEKVEEKISIAPLKFIDTEKKDKADLTSTFYQVAFKIWNRTSRDIFVHVPTFSFVAPKREMLNYGTGFGESELKPDQSAVGVVTFVLNKDYHIPLIEKEGFLIELIYYVRASKEGKKRKFQATWKYENGKFKIIDRTSKSYTDGVMTIIEGKKLFYHNKRWVNEKELDKIIKETVKVKFPKKGK